MTTAPPTSPAEEYLNAARAAALAGFATTDGFRRAVGRGLMPRHDTVIGKRGKRWRKSTLLAALGAKEAAK